jgi:hypothetical protein
MKVLISSPIYEKPAANYLTSIAEILVAGPKLGHQISYQIEEGNACIRKARNALAYKFRFRSSADWMLMIDSDIGFTPADVDTLLASNELVVTGLYKKRQRGDADSIGTPRYTVNTLPEGFCPNIPTIQEVLYAPGGFLLIHRNVLDYMAADYPESEFVSDDYDEEKPVMHDFFPSFIHNRRLLTEDYGFCQKWRDIGGKVYANCAVHVKHRGAEDY